MRISVQQRPTITVAPIVAAPCHSLVARLVDGDRSSDGSINLRIEQHEVILPRGVGLALSTTMIGLCIAIPALIAANWLGRRLEILSSRLDVLVEALEARRR